MRRAANERPAEQAALLLGNLAAVADDLAAGSIVVLGERALRIRRLPLA
ncbi:MAG: hypothetical protein ACR2LX_06770 [Jatrophihabitans sp.]